MPDGIPRNTRHFDSSVLPIPHQSGLRLSQPFGNVALFLGRNVLKRRHAVVLHVPGGGGWDDQLRDTGKTCWNCGAVIQQ